MLLSCHALSMHPLGTVITGKLFDELRLVAAASEGQATSRGSIVTEDGLAEIARKLADRSRHRLQPAEARMPATA